MGLLSRSLMEVEVKLRLPNKASHQKLLSVLSPFHITTYDQNYSFWDGLDSELSSRSAVLRLRFHEKTDLPKCFVTLQANVVLANGVSRVEENEEEVDYAIGKACFSEPQKFMDADSRVLRWVKEEFGVKGFECLGGFGNVRNVYEWSGVKLEVVEAFEEVYEIECQSVEPEKVKGMITDFLKENGIQYSDSDSDSDSVMSKFAKFSAGTGSLLSFLAEWY